MAKPSPSLGDWAVKIAAALIVIAFAAAAWLEMRARNEMARAFTLRQVRIEARQVSMDARQSEIQQDTRWIRRRLEKK